MRMRRVVTLSIGGVAIVLVVLVVLASIDSSYFPRSPPTATTPPSQNSATTAVSSAHSFSRFTTYTTVSKTTFPYPGGTTYRTTTGDYSGCIPPVQCYLTTVIAGINASNLNWSTTFQAETISSNLTVYYYPACIVRENFEQTCPTIDTANHSPSIGNVILLLFNSTYYYEVQYNVSNNVKMFSFEVWFTNSSIFCVTPQYENFNTCP